MGTILDRGYYKLKQKCFVSLDAKTVIVKRGAVGARCSYGDGTHTLDPSMCVSQSQF